MKRIIAICVAFLAIGVGAFAQNNDSNGKKAEKKAQDILPAQPPKESSGTVKGSGLKPYDGHTPPPKYKEVPPPPKDKDKKK